MNKVYFVGAGPGDPKLITVRGKELVETADLILYAGSLVPKEMLVWAKPEAVLQDTSGMTLEEIIDSIKKGWERNKLVVRLHTGEPSLYGATYEQFNALDELNIPYEVVPGVTAAFLCASRLKKELTVPEKTQTVIFTRVKGRTPVPENEDLEVLSKIGASMAIYLSVSKISEVAKTLSQHYGPEAPIVVGYRLGWPGEIVIEGTVKDIAEKVRKAGISKHAIILVGPCLEKESVSSIRSRLYSKDFSHGYRKSGS